MKRKLIVGLDHAAPIPLHTDISTGDFKGFEVDLMDQIAKELNFELSHSVSYWKNIIDELQEGKIDLICSGATKTPEREENFLFSTPYLEFNLCLVGHTNELSTIDNLREKRIGVRIKTEAEDYLKDKFPGKELILFDSNEEIYSQLDKREIDALVDDSPIAFGFVEDNQELEIIELLPNTFSQYAIMLNNSDTGLKQEIDQVMLQLQSSGFLAEIRQKWFNDTAL